MYILKLKNRLTGAERVLEFESAEARASYNFNIHAERYWMIDKTEGLVFAPVTKSAAPGV